MEHLLVRRVWQRSCRLRRSGDPEELRGLALVPAARLDDPLELDSAMREFARAHPS